MKDSVVVGMSLFLLAGCAEPIVEAEGEATLAMRNVDEPPPHFESVVLATSEGSVCRVSKDARATAILEHARPGDPRVIDDPFVRQASASDLHARADTTCEPLFEEWALRSFVLGHSAPYDVAALTIPMLGELKLLLSGGGIVLGLTNHGTAAACVSALSAGLDYAQQRGWVCR